MNKKMFDIDLITLIFINISSLIIAFLIGTWVVVNCNRDLKELTIDDCNYIKEIDNIDYCLIKVGK